MKETLYFIFGSVVFLICGDFYDDDIIRRVTALEPGRVFWLLARSFEEEDFDQERWDTQEMTEVIDRVKMLRATTFIVNYLASKRLTGDFCFGGAWAISGQGDVIKSLPLGAPGILMIDL